MSKVILLAPTPPPIGGIAQWTVRMMNAELKNGWKVEVVDEKILGNRDFFGDKVKHDYKAEIKRCLHIWTGLKKALVDEDAKVVHSCIAANTMPIMREYICALITKVRHRKFIIHFRCTIPNIVSGKLNVFLLKRICNLSDCVMVLNKQSEDFIKRISHAKTCLIPNFVDVDEIAEEHNIRDKIQRVLYVGGCIESKGCLNLIEVAKAFPNIEFKLIGKPESKVVEAAKQADNVILTGPMDHNQVTKELGEADVFAFLTYFPGEGFSNALAEAMANGLPCLATDWSANADMLEGKGGEIVPIKNSAEAIHALKRMSNPEVRKKHSVFNIKKVSTVYKDSVVQNMYIDCYEELLRDNG